MSNNESFRFICHLTGCGRDKNNIKKIFMLGGMEVKDFQVKCWRLDSDNKNYLHMSDEAFEAFMRGMFEYRDLMRDQGVMVFNFPGNTLNIKN